MFNNTNAAPIAVLQKCVRSKSLMNYYFEFDDHFIGKSYNNAFGHRTIPSKYCVRYGVQGLHSLMPSKLSYLAQRIWAEDEEGKVSFIKNRNGNLHYADMKEFLWVKLSAVKV